MRGPPVEFCYPGELRRVRFLRRPNRFLAQVQDEELGLLEAHVPNPGRLKELLPEGGTFGHIVEARPPPAGRPGRRTRWTLVNVEAPGNPDKLVSIDTGVARPLVETALRLNRLPPVDRWGEWRSEVVWGHHRFDHAVLARPEGRRPLALLEVKSSNLKEGRSALFPDAPSARAGEHAEALARFARRGGRAGLLFLVQRDDVEDIRPYGAMDPRFARAVVRAGRAGVRLMGRSLHVFPGGACLGEELPVGPPRWEPASDLGQRYRGGSSASPRGSLSPQG